MPKDKKQGYQSVVSALSGGIRKQNKIKKNKEQQKEREKLAKSILDEGESMQDVSQNSSSNNTEKKTKKQLKMEERVEKAKQMMLKDSSHDLPADAMLDTQIPSLSNIQPKRSVAKEYLIALEGDKFNDFRSDIENPIGIYYDSPCMLQHPQSSTNTKLQKLSKSVDVESNVQKYYTLKNYGWGDQFSSKRIGCRCSSCEMKLVKDRLYLNPGIKLVILVDIENFGFEDLFAIQLKKLPEKELMKINWLLQNISNVFCWCFHAELFYSHISTKEGKAVMDRLVSKNFSLESKEESITCLLDAFAKVNNLRFTNCGQKKQAADFAIIDACEKLYELNFANVLVISKDKGLTNACQMIMEANPNPKLNYSVLTMFEALNINIFDQIEMAFKKKK